MPIIRRHEWLWVATWSLILLILTTIPFLYGATLSTPTYSFSGFVIGLEDGNSYLANMQEGRSGQWLFQLAYTPEPHPGEFFFIYYLLLGKLAGLLHLSNIIVFHLSRLITTLFSMLTSYFFIAYFTNRVWVRQIALLILEFSGGLGWLWLLLGGAAQLGMMPVDLWSPDASFFLAVLTYPHLSLAQGILLIFVTTGLEYVEVGRRRYGLIAAGCGLAVSLIHPYTLPVIGVVLAFYLLAQYYPQRRLWSSGLRLLFLVLPSLPYLFYGAWVFYYNPAFVAWKDQNLLYSPNPLHYLLGFGLTLGLALGGLWITRRQSSYKNQFLRIWIVSVPFLLYLPLTLQRRFLDGYQAPLSILAALGLVRLLEQPGWRRWRLVLSTAVLGVMSLTNVLLLVGAITILSQRPETLFLPASKVAAATWLSQQTGPAVVLSSYPTGNYLPTVVNMRTFVGHGAETVNSNKKREQVQRFFNATTSGTWRRDLLDQFNVRYVYYGPDEKAIGDFSPADAPYLKEAYRNEEVQIFEVELR